MPSAWKVLLHMYCSAHCQSQLPCVLSLLLPAHHTDIQLACLAGPMLFVPNELCTTWIPSLDCVPEELRTFVKVR